jgi:hypothetical protein
MNILKRVDAQPASGVHRMKTSTCFAAAAAAFALSATGALAQTVSDASFVNGLVLDGGLLDKSIGSNVERRVGFFSDLYYDASRNAWWGLSDRGPGGGTLPYETRLQRFTLDVNPSTGAISNFAVAQTIKFSNTGAAMNGLAPNPGNVLGNSLDPEGFVINPRNGNFLVSDEYGPSVVEFDRSGSLVRRYTTPTNVVPRSAANVPNFASDAGNTQGKRENRGFEGLAVSPDGRYAYAMLQSAMLDEGAGSGVHNRIVKFDTATGLAVAQYAYKMDASNQGRGISALVALGDEKFMVLERNNRGVGVGADLSPPDKNVYQIDLAGATDVSGIDLDSGAPFTAVSKSTKLIDLDADTLAALGNKSPEKWEGLAVGPKLSNGKYLILAGTDNDYSVTQNDADVQFDVWFRMTDADPSATSIQCPIGSVLGCTGTLTSEHTLLPGVLHAYTASIDGFTAPVPEPEALVLMLVGLGLIGFTAGKRWHR